MIPQSVLKAAAYFAGTKTHRPDLSVVRVRSEGGSATLITEATNGHIAIQITSNDSEYELDDFSLIVPMAEIKKYLKTEEEIEFLDDDGSFPDIDEAVEKARAQNELHPAMLDLKYFNAANMALRSLFTNAEVDICASENINLPITLSTNGTSRDDDEVVVDIFIMGMRK